MSEINQQPSTPQDQPSITPDKHIHPRIWITALVVFGLIVGYVVFAYSADRWPFDAAQTQKDDSTSPQTLSSPGEGEFEGWQTYRNEGFGFEFRYPDGWVIKTVTKRELTLENSEEIAGVSINDGVYGFSVLPQGTAVGGGFTNNFTTTKSRAVVGGIDSERIDFHYIGGYPQFQETGEVWHSQFRFVDYNRNNRNEYGEINIGSFFNPPNKGTVEILEQILSTFRFLD